MSFEWCLCCFCLIPIFSWLLSKHLLIMLASTTQFKVVWRFLDELMLPLLAACMPPACACHAPCIEAPLGVVQCGCLRHGMGSCMVGSWEVGKQVP